MTSSLPTTIILQSDPGGEPFEREVALSPPVRLGKRDGIVLAAVAERGAPLERRGLGADLNILGRSRLRGTLQVPENLDAGTRRKIEALAARRKVRTPGGSEPWHVETWETFCDPYRGLFWRVCYGAKGPFVAAGMGRHVSLLSDRWLPAHGRFEGGWTFYPAGCDQTVVDERGRKRLRSVSPHRPPIRVKSLGTMGEQVEFARPPGGAACGKRDPDASRPADMPVEVIPHWIGMFVDLIPFAFTFDGIERRQLGEHLAEFGLPALDLPAALPVDVESAEYLMDVVEAEHALAIRLDEEAQLWL